MDNVGKFEIPNLVTSFYFETCPSVGGETLFANVLNAYTKINYNNRMDINSLIGLYDKENRIDYNEYDMNGIRRLNSFNSVNYKDILQIPFVIKPYVKSSLKSFLFSPIRFIKFQGFSEERSWDLVEHIFAKYINTPDNVVSIKWEPNDLVIFNNRLLIHSTTPTEIYSGENRFYKTIFLNSKIKITN